MLLSDDILYKAQELRGLSEVLLLALTNTESEVCHMEEAIRVVCEIANDLVDSIENITDEGRWLYGKKDKK